MRKLHYFLKSVLFICLITVIGYFVSQNKVFLYIAGSIVGATGVLAMLFAPLLIFNKMRFNCPFCKGKVDYTGQAPGTNGNPPMYYNCPNCGDIKVSGYVVGKLKIEKI